MGEDFQTWYRKSRREVAPKTSLQVDNRTRFMDHYRHKEIPDDADGGRVNLRLGFGCLVR